ncbi:hypothetical protein BAUCODRAFT_319342 [Baudoinia panamericana UAMH 10762]|uniref:Uncharacterized protein n=1 Tax=Baudoinia panamericana (strain UAMH 10762) TaxID=717646 RepID=M2MX74_BAUPA|nr:uncharacterized protein BAUCODRAFT_319342 [Baudoinia panamericana UAMH 10762]EMC91249.1 hypothetical protein BAUCODRAFT_319342 [Baudoinia panamericana UAMH 10762]
MASHERTPPPCKAYLLECRLLHSYACTRRLHDSTSGAIRRHTDTQYRPRFIAASKKPCFLCYCFIRAHNTYGIGRSHGEVYLQWTVPNGRSLAPQARKRLNAALRATANDVEQAAKRSKKKPSTGLYMHPLQTVSKRLEEQFATLSASTVAPTLLTVLQEDVAGPDIGPSKPGVAPGPSCASTSKVNSQRSLPEVQNLIDHSIERPESSGASDLPIATERLLDIKRAMPVDPPAYVRLGDLELFVEREAPCGDPNQTANLGTALCRVMPVLHPQAQSFDYVAKIDVSELNHSPKTLCSKKEGASLCFILSNAGSDYAVELLWD